MAHVETFVNDVHCHTCRANDNEAFVIQYLPPTKCKIKTFNPHHACVNNIHSGLLTLAINRRYIYVIPKGNINELEFALI